MPTGLNVPLAERTVPLADEAATSAFGAALAQAVLALGPRPVQVQLSGDLGAGKTTLSRAILRGLGHTGRVRSPTYTLVEPYDVAGTTGTQKVYHFDLYRFADPEEWTDAGFRDCFAEPALCLVEWPEKAQALLGTPDLHIALAVDVVHETYDDGVEHAPRLAHLSVRTQTGLQLLQSLPS
ncbi:tRNA (adenosine(37)-N6)-threonylcarbamoyltransferase complex ATPase subunit type 1 TsaE [Ralstonia sp. 24A2]|uniref:tRNA (adenosine(37)-N6)-threonylcarbamoyltransferase complex ATPase subunit type 1 TsaE n=1 Tax=Ralstonia sp. 24A2 TaxID=3447364 RepID=UPI003F69F0D3